MPLKITRDGVEIEITDDELKPVIDPVQAQAAEAAKKADEAAAEVKRLTEDPNSGYAAARREAEKQRKAAEADKLAAERERDELLAKLAEGDKTVDELKALQQQLKDANAKATEASTQIEGLKAAHAQDLAFVDTFKVRGQRLESVRRELQERGVDLADRTAVEAAITEIKGEAPGWFVDGKGTPYTPSRGSQNPPSREGDLTIEDAAKLPPDQYYDQVFKGNAGKA